MEWNAISFDQKVGLGHHWLGEREKEKRTKFVFAVTDIFGRECHVAQDSSAMFFKIIYSS